MDKTESVAQAIYEADYESGYDADDPRTFWRAENSYWSPVVGDNWIRIARAAIAAMDAR